jgi:hypothetical protein
MTDDLLPVVEGGPKPDGYMGIVDQNGQRWWMRLDVLKRKAPTTPLSEEQIERIRTFKEILAEHDTTTLEKAIENFRRDAHPEPEIRLWERIAAVYAEELRDRFSAAAAERRLLFSAVLLCSFGAPDVSALITLDRELRDLPDLDRVIRRFRGLASAP